MAWTEERVEILKALWAEGVTASEIAKTLGAVSRNAVIGKAHRLGLSNRAATQKGATPKPEEPCELSENSAKKRDAAKTDKSAAKKAIAADVELEKAATEEKASKRSRAKTAAAKDVDAEPTAAQPEAAETNGAHAEPLDVEADAEEANEEVINPVAALAAEAERTARKLTLLELNERTCKWPIGDPSTDDFYFCGLPCAPEKPYCAAHVQLAYQPMSSRRDRERSRARAASA